jgi:hypothetical protein
MAQFEPVCVYRFTQGALPLVMLMSLDFLPF